jgi:hypothetical protein
MWEQKWDDPSNWWGRSVAGWGASPSARGGVTGYWSVVLRPLGSSESKGPKQPSGARRPGSRAVQSRRTGSASPPASQ